ncbi:MAG: V-type ATP synthase subunit F [Victivallales bacterium]|nr:V-type ATP synthase subunit F [Victivallales bacterium]
MSAYHIIGDQDTVLGYRFAGVSGEAVENAEQAKTAFENALNDSGITVLLVTEAVEDMIPDMVMRHRMAAKPPYLAVVQDIWGPRGGRKSLQELINEAVGIRLSSSDDKDN